MAVDFDTTQLMQSPFSIGKWLVEPTLNRLSYNGTRVQLELKMMDVLVCLASRAGEVVARQEIVDQVWETEFISDNTLTHAINEIRTALGDDARRPSYIETIHRRGYRLIAPIERAHPDRHGECRVAPFPPPDTSSTTDHETDPYPGLSPLTETHAAYFFGREAEIAQTWRKLTSRRLLAVIGPSGAGKTSFVRAGLLPARPRGWSSVYCHPGDDPFVELARALVPVFEGDAQTVASLVHLHDPTEAAALVSRWRKGHDDVLVVVDQFEEIFTICTSEQRVSFVQFLVRLVEEIGVHVLLCMRDDFLYRCHAIPSLHAIFEDLTVLDQPQAHALRRAIIEPARCVGYRFEDEDLPERMIAEVDGERAVLPVLAFAMSRLWEQRDTGRRLLTQVGFDTIGGVAGALARHAEATLIAIGADRTPLVREIFRNLITAEGTRAVREVKELLSVFDAESRDRAAEVVERLIEARLLTSFEDDALEGSDGRHRIEVVHESLITTWPRLVRWRARDAHAAQFRDQLRQAARTWDEHCRAVDFLWRGRAYHEFNAWLEIYPGGLTDLEAAFAEAMWDREAATRRHRRGLVAVTLVLALVASAVFGGLWYHGLRETRRAEAQELLAHGLYALESDPTAALAWARASLQLRDTRNGRAVALKALAKGPIARFARMPSESEVVLGAVFSPDGEWLGLQSFDSIVVHRRAGGEPVMNRPFPGSQTSKITIFFDAAGERVAVQQSKNIHTYTLAGFDAIAHQRLGADPRTFARSNDGGLFFSQVRDSTVVERWRFGSRPVTVDTTPPLWAVSAEASGDRVAYVPADDRRSIFVRRVGEPGSHSRLVRAAPEPISDILLHPAGDWIAVRGQDSQQITVWPLVGESDSPIRTLDAPGLPELATDRPGRRVAAAGLVGGTATVHLWDLGLTPAALPLTLQSRMGAERLSGLTIDPSGQWAVASIRSFAVFWPLPEHPVAVIPGEGVPIYSLAFTPDGGALVIPSSGTGGVRLLPLNASPARQLLGPGSHIDVEVEPGGRFAVISGGEPPGVAVSALDGSDVRTLNGISEPAVVGPTAYDPRRELVAASAIRGPSEAKGIRIWNLSDGSVRHLAPPEDAGEGFTGGLVALEFLPNGDLVSSGRAGVRRWRLVDGSSDLLISGSCGDLAVAPDGAFAIVGCATTDGQLPTLFLDLTTGSTRPLEGFTGFPVGVAVSPSGDTVAVGNRNGLIEIGELGSDEPHLLFGHDGPVMALAFSPDGRSLASADQGGTVRVWPVPDLSTTPLHALPLDELLTRLAGFSNLQVVRDDTKPIGWTFVFGAFPGWDSTPVF